MTTRTKTLWYATRLTAASMADATLTALPTITVYTENSSRTFRSVMAWLNFEGMSTVTGNTITEHRLACSVNGAGATTVTETDDITNTGENLGGRLGPFDFTSHFTTNYPAADSSSVVFSAYIDVSTGTGLTTCNVSVIFCITYEYDDTAATQYTTAIIPLESDLSAMATTEDEIGTNQIPQLTGSGGLLENIAGVTVRQQFVVVEGNAEDAAGTTDFVMNTRIDTGTTITHAASERALGSDNFHTFVHIESPSAGAAHAWKAWTTGSGAMNHAAHTLYVTYQFTLSGTTEFLNSVQLPIDFDIAGFSHGPTASNIARGLMIFFIEEPTTITLKQSGLRLNYAGAGTAAGPVLAAGSQADRTYTDGISQQCGCQSVQQRIDSGSAQGAGISVARGRNTFTIDVFSASPCFMSGYLLLNYKSGVSSQGIGAHNHTVWWNLSTTYNMAALAIGVADFSGTPIIIPESSYFVNNIGAWWDVWHGGLEFSAGLAIRYNSGEGRGDPSYISGMWHSGAKDAEIGVYLLSQSIGHLFKRYPNDVPVLPDIQSRADIEYASRTWRLINPTNSSLFGRNPYVSVTYYAITFTAGGDVTGSAGGTVGIDIFLLRQVSPPVIEHVVSTSRSGNGAYTATVYDNTLGHFSEAREDGTHIGRSDNFTPSGSA